MYENEPSYEDPHRLTSNPLRDVAVTFYRESIAVHSDVQPPEQTAAIESHASHEYVKQDARHIAIDAESVRGVEWS